MAYVDELKRSSPRVGSDGISPFSRNEGLGDSTLPRAMTASEIPRTVIETENTVFDNYMRRLNEVWMRRIEFANVNKARVDSNRHPRPPKIRRLETRPHSVPPFIKDLAITRQRRRRRRRGPPGGEADTKSYECGRARTQYRSRSAHEFAHEPTAAWVVVRDKPRGAYGLGPTFCERRDRHEHKTPEHPAVRPDTAPTGRWQRGAGPQSRKSSKLGKHLSAFHNAQVTRVEEGNDELFTACRKDIRVKDSSAYWCDRTHSERLDPEIERRRGRRLNAGRHRCHERTASTQTATHKNAQETKIKPLLPQSTQQPMQPEPGIGAPDSFPSHHFPSQHKVCENISRRESRTRSSEDDDELEKITTCAPCHEVEYVPLASNQSFQAEAEQNVDPQQPANTSQTLLRRSDPAQEGSEGNRFPGGQHLEIRSQAQSSVKEGVDIQSRDIHSSVDKRLSIFTSPCADNQTKPSPSMKSDTLEVSRVESGDEKIAPGGAYTFSWVSKCDQQCQIGTVGVHDVHEERVDTHRDNAVVFFSVKDLAVAAGGVHINLWGRGVEDNSDLVTSNSKSGDLTLKLICGSRSSNEGDDNADRPSGYAVGVGGGSINCRGPAVEVRLFVSNGEEEAGVCTLNLASRPDKGQHPIVMLEKARQREGSEEQSPSKNEPQTTMTTPAPDLTDIHRSSVWLVEETAKHIRAIEEVRLQFHIVDQLDDGSEDEGLPLIQTKEATEGAKAIHNGMKETHAAVDYCTSSDDERSVAVVFQSHARSRATRENVKRPIKERTATSNPQAIARQRFPICKVCQTREYEVHVVEQREAAAVRLQSTARRRLAMETAQRRRNKEEIVCTAHGKHVDAGAHIRCYATDRLARENRRNQVTTYDKVASRVQRPAKSSLAIALETGSGQKLDDQIRLSIQLVVETVFKDAASCVQGAASKALLQITTLRDDYELDIQRHREAISDALRNESSSYVRYSTTSDQTRGCEIVLGERREAALQIQRAVRCRQARDRAFTLRRLRTEDAWQKQEGDEPEKRQLVEAKAAECIQGQARGRQAAMRVAAVKQENDANTRRMQEGRKERRQAAQCIQRAVRCNQAIGRLFELLRQQGVGPRVELRRQQERSASCIQRVIRCRQAPDCAASSRQQRDDDMRRKREREAELERQWVVETEAANCIQRQVRSRQAVMQVTVVRQQRDAEIRRMREEERARRRAVATEYVQCTFEQASELLQQRDITRRAELERMTELEQQGRAASCIQRAVRCRQARDRATIVRRRRDDDILWKREEVKLERRLDVDTKAAECIQRQVRSRQAVMLVSAVRQQRHEDSWRMQKEKRARRRAAAAECVQSAVRCHQAVGRISEIRRQRAMRRRAELELRQGRAASYIQRVVRCRQARDRAATLRRRRDDGIRRKREEAELRRKWELETEAAECIQRQVRCHHAVLQVAAVRQQRDADMRRVQEEEGERRRAVAIEYVQRAVALASELLRQQDVIRKAELEQQQGRVVSCIQRAARCRQARDRVSILRRRSDDDIRRKREKNELERRWKVEIEAAECIQRQVRSRQAIMRVTAVRQQKDEDMWRMQEEEGARRRVVAAECVQRAVRCHQAVGRVPELRRQRDMRQRAVQEWKQGRAASCIQRAVWCRQARDRVAILRRRHDDIWRKREEADLERIWEVETEAAECIQRQVRSHQSVMQVAAVRQRRDEDVRCIREEEGARRRAVAAECVQRAVRCHQALGRVSELRRQRDMRQRPELEWQQGRAASCIQRAVWCRQARVRVSILRRRRNDKRRNREEADLERIWEVETEAAERIQRQMRSRQAIRRVTAVRQKRDEDMRRMQEEEGVRRREVAAECIQLAVRYHQAIGRVSELRRQRDMRRKTQLEWQQGRAASCIQRAVRCRLARDSAAILRRRRDADIRRDRKEAELEQIWEVETEAAEFIQRQVRSRQAVMRVNTARQQRDEKMRRMQEEEGVRRHAVAVECIHRAVRCHQAVRRVSELRRQRDMRRREDVERQHDRAASCIQRDVWCRQARNRVSTLRRRRNDDTRRRWKDSELERTWEVEVEAEAAECIQRQVRQAVMQVTAMRQQTNVDVREKEGVRRRALAAECVQRVVRCHQAVERVSEMRQQRDMRRRMELERQQGRAALCIQRAVRCRQARDLVTTLMRRRDDDLGQKQEQIELERRWEVETEGAECIQRQVRSRQVVMQVVDVRKQRDDDTRRMQEEEEARRRAVAADCVQRAVRCHQAVWKISELRQLRNLRRGTDVERHRRRAASCIQRAVWCWQARDRVAVLRRKRKTNEQSKAKIELERQKATPGEAAECIQRAVRCRQVVRRVHEYRLRKVINAPCRVLKHKLDEQKTEGRGKEVTTVQTIDDLVREGTQGGSSDNEDEPESVSILPARTVKTERQLSGETPGVNIVVQSSVAMLLAEQKATTQPTGIPSPETPKESNDPRDPFDVTQGTYHDVAGGKKHEQGFYSKGRVPVGECDDAGGRKPTGLEDGRPRHESRGRQGGSSSTLLTINGSRSDREYSPSSNGEESPDAVRDIVDAYPTAKYDAESLAACQDVSCLPPKYLPNNRNYHSNNADNVTDESWKSDSSGEYSSAAQLGVMEEEGSAGGSILPQRPAETRKEDVCLPTRNEQLNSDDVAPAVVACSDAIQLASSSNEDVHHDALNSSGKDTEEYLDSHAMPTLSSIEKMKNHDKDIFAANHDVAGSWETHVDEDTGPLYLYHSGTKTSSWDLSQDNAVEATKNGFHDNSDWGLARSDEEIADDPVASQSARDERAQDNAVKATKNGFHDNSGWGLARSDEEIAEDTVASQSIGDERATRRKTRNYGVKDKEGGGDAITGKILKTGESIRDKPRSLLGGSETETHGEGETGVVTRSGDIDDLNPVSGGDAAVMIDSGHGANEQDGEWEEVIDQATSSVYFYNRVTRQSAWELPEGAITTAVAGAIGATGVDAENLFENSG